MAIFDTRKTDLLAESLLFKMKKKRTLLESKGTVSIKASKKINKEYSYRD